MGCLGNQLVNKHVFSGSALKDSPPRESESRERIAAEWTIFSFLPKQAVHAASTVGAPCSQSRCKAWRGDSLNPAEKKGGLGSGETHARQEQKESLSQSGVRVSQYQEAGEESGILWRAWWKRNISTWGQGGSVALLPSSALHSPTVRKHCLGGHWLEREPEPARLFPPSEEEVSHKCFWSTPWHREQG